MAIQRIPDFLDALKQSGTNQATIQALCHSELDYLRDAYQVEKTAIKGIYKGLRTYIRAIASYRQAIYHVSPDHPARSFFKASDQDVIHNANQNQSARMRGLTDRESTIKNIDGYLETSLKLCSASSYIDNILGIAALTGRRVSEVAYFTTFKPYDREEFDELYGQYGIVDCDGLLVENLAKKETYEMRDRRLRVNEENVNRAVIPVLQSADAILEAIESLRNRKRFDSHEQFHNQTSKELAKRVKKHYHEFLGPCACHDLRKAYCRIVFDYYADMPEKAVLEVYSVILAQTSPANYAKFSCE